VICGDILEWWRSSERFARCWFVHNKGTSLGLMVVITIVHWGYKATNRTGGGHHLVNGETTRDDNLVEWEHVDHILTMAHTLNAMDFPPEGPFRTLLLLLLGPHFDSSPGALSVWQHLTTFVGKGWLSTGSQRQHPPRSQGWNLLVLGPELWGRQLLLDTMFRQFVLRSSVRVRVATNGFVWKLSTPKIYWFIIMFPYIPFTIAIKWC
jgi:hypothetical protein